MTSRFKKIFLLFLSLFTGIGLFIFVLNKIGLKEIFNILSIFSFWKGLIIFLFLLLEMTILTWRWSIILKSQGYKASFKKLFIAKIVGFSVNFITPILYTGGEPARAYVLEKETKIPFADGMTSIIIDEIQDIVCGSLLFMLSLLFLIINFKIPQYILVPLTLIISGALAFWIYFYINIRKNQGFFTSIINFLKLNKLSFFKNNKDSIIKSENEIINFFKYKEKAFFSTFLITALSLIMSLGNCKLILYFLNYNLSLKEIVFIKILFIIAYLIPIPAALGSLEGIGAVVFIILGLNAGAGITYALVVRIFYVIIAGMGMIFLSHFGVKLTKFFLNKDLDKPLT